MGNVLDALLQLAGATAQHATRVWPDGPEARGETWRAAWLRIWNEEPPEPLFTARRAGHAVALYSDGRALIEDPATGQSAIYQLRLHNAAPTALERTAERFRQSIADRVGEFLGAPMPSRRQR